MAGRIVVLRIRGWGGGVLRFAVRVDGMKVGTVGLGRSQGFDIGAGTHRVRTSQLRYSSKTLVMSVSALAGTFFAARLLIFLHRDPAAEPRFGQTDISTDTIRRR